MNSCVAYASSCLVACILCGCGSDPSPEATPSDAGFDAAASEPDAWTPWESGTDAAPTCFKCSEDLHDLLDCDGALVRTCTEDQSCDPNAGACVPACDGAKANKANVGCDFYAAPPRHSTDSMCFAVTVANTWTAPIGVQVEIEGTELDVTRFARIPSGGGLATTYGPLPDGKIPPGEVAMLFLSQGADSAPAPCPEGVSVVRSSPLAPADEFTTYKASTYHVRTSRPAMAYDFAPYNGAASHLSSANTLLATSAWDTNYVAMSPNGPGGTIQLVATEEDTEISIVPTSALSGNRDGSIPPVAANDLGTFVIGKGELLELEALGYDGLSLDGTVIQATKPIGMWLGGMLFVDQCCIDMSHQQVPGVKALGHEYVAVRYRDRMPAGPPESVPWKILGLVNGTTLTYDPVRPEGAPERLDGGESAWFYASDPFVVRSQDDDHPLYVASYMTGCGVVSDQDDPCVGDAEYVNVVPPAQYLSRYVFMSDPSYPEANLVVVRPKAADGTFKDVTLDCAGVLGDWQPVGGEGVYEYTRFDLSRGDYETVGACDNGRHAINSDAPFGFTVWGWGSRPVLYAGHDTAATSYALPSPSFVRRQNKIVVPPVPK